MTTLIEGTHPGGFLVWEAFRDYTRETVTVAAGTLEPGTVLGRITASGKYAAHDPAAVDGTETAVAVLWGKADASGAGTPPPSRWFAAPPSSTATTSSSRARRPRARSRPPMRRSSPRASSSADPAPPRNPRTGGIPMATMDIFEGDAFTIVELTRALENIPFKPALLSGSNLFSPARRARPAPS